MAEITQIKDDKIVVREYLQAYAGGTLPICTSH